MPKCSNCGKELGSEATFCESCASSVLVESVRIDSAINDEPIVETYLDLEEKFGKLSDKWAWAMVCAGLCGLLGIIGTSFLVVIYRRYSGVFLTLSILVVLLWKILFWMLDLDELKRKGYRFGGLIWFGLFLVPIYLFIRAAKTTKRYGYAVVYCVLLVVLPIGARLILPLLTSITVNNMFNDGDESLVKLVDPAEVTETLRKKSDTSFVSSQVVQRGSFTDNRDGKKYRIVKIGNQTWMAENLNYQPQSGKSWCYDNNNFNCNKYGKLYDWRTALKVCPSGWYLPDTADWRRMGRAVVGGERGKKLKAKSGWENDYVGTDDYGFSALPSGARDGYDGSFDGEDNVGIWWTATEYNNIGAYYQFVHANMSMLLRDVDSKDYGFAVRCVQDRDVLDTTPTHHKTKLSVDTSGRSNQYLKGGTINGGRSRTSIQNVIMQNIATIRYAYNERLRVRPGLTGKVTVKFAINEFGEVIFAQVAETTANDPDFENTLVNMVKKWKFEKIDMPGDVTEVTYPFVFSQ